RLGRCAGQERREHQDHRHGQRAVSHRSASRRITQVTGGYYVRWSEGNRVRQARHANRAVLAGGYASYERSNCERRRSNSSGSRRMPRCRPISPRIVLISFSDFLPKFLVLSSSPSLFCTRSAIVRMLAVFKQLDARTESSSSSTLRKRLSLSSARGPVSSRSVSSASGVVSGKARSSSK